MKKYPHSIQEVAHAYDTISPHFSQTRGHAWKEFGIFNEYITPPCTILDLGCGNGRLRDSLSKDVTYTGIDVSKELLKEARSLHPEATFQEASMTALPFANNTFTHVSAIASLQHLPSRKERETCIQEVHRVLQEGGYFFISNWDIVFSKHKKNIFHIIKDWIQSAGRYAIYDYPIPWKSADGSTQTMRYYHHFTEKEIRHLLEQNNFSIEDSFVSSVSPRNRNLCIIAKKQ